MTAGLPDGAPAWLFCPASRPDRYPKALAASDVVIVDLEDAVPASQKVAARESLRALAVDGAWSPARTVVRVNSATSPHHAEDVELCRSLEPLAVMLPKTERMAEVLAIELDVVMLVESAAGLGRLDELIEARNAVGLMWGADDLVASLGGTSSRNADGTYRDVVRFARARALVAAKAAGLHALDAVHMDIPDLDGFASQCEDSVASGFDAVVSIHPSQVPVVRAAYTPSPERVRWATELLSSVGDGAGVSTYDGAMVDEPIFPQARQVLELARASARWVS